MLDSTTFLQIDALGLLAALFTASALVISYLRNRNKREEKITARWLIRNDPRVGQIVLSLPYLTSTSKAKGPLARKKIRLLLELREVIKTYQPEIINEELKVICRDIIFVSYHLEKQRAKK